ncbi:hypothetical protein QE152_g38970 [Popillia japonica]|uniref:Uncharacterized protein n=1 Tax=Popillia japonica TaxID=7064 RepID=A0AAW1HVE8_POPJA
MNYEGKGELDAMEFGRDIGIAIDSMKILLSSFPVSRDTPGIDREYNENFSEGGNTMKAEKIMESLEVADKLIENAKENE